jgi:hypothetical protein
LKWLNLTNVKLGNSGTKKFLTTFQDLQKNNKVFIDNLILICNGFENEDCLDVLADILSQPNCPIKTLILSKNKIASSTCRAGDVNHFQILFESVASSKLEGLYLISCEIGKDSRDKKILIDMLCKNTNLISLRLFGNEINKMEDFTEILQIFSEKNGEIKNKTLKSLDISKNGCKITVTESFLDLISNLKLEYLDINQNTMDQKDKEDFRRRTNELTEIKIIY